MQSGFGQLSSNVISKRKVIIGREYKIKFDIPDDYDPSNVLRKLPSPISNEMTEIYNYSVEKDGFYFLDNLVDQNIAGLAMKLFIDEALANSANVNIQEQ